MICPIKIKAIKQLQISNISALHSCFFFCRFWDISDKMKDPQTGYAGDSFIGALNFCTHTGS